MRKTSLLAALAAATLLLAQARFDYQVRDDFFAGFAGDMQAFQRGMSTAEKVLAENPNHAEAMVWHGLGTFFLGGRELQKGNQQNGMEQLQKGAAEMNRAVALAPDNIGVRIPRGAGLMTAAREMPDSPLRQGFLENARADFQRVFDLEEQRGCLDRMGAHPLGELLQGLADVYSRQGKTAEAEKYYGMIQARLKGTEYDRRAALWMQTKQPLPAAQAGCVGCHTGNK